MVQRFKKIAAFIAAFSKKNYGMVVWQGSQWLYDNPCWITAEIKYGAKGVLFMMIGAIIINFSILLYYKKREVSWLLWNDGINVVKNLNQSIGLKLFLTILSFSEIIFASSLISVPIIFLLVIVIMALLRISILSLKIKVMEKFFMFFILSFYQDSFIATAYFRKNCEKGLNKNDMIIFLSSSVVSIIYWAVRNGLITELVVKPIIQ